jgi:dihydroxyacetone kinase
MGWGAAIAALNQAPPGEGISRLSEVMASALLDAVGASSGPLYAMALQRAGAAVRGRADLDAPALASWIEGMSAGIIELGKASRGDKTMVDAFAPAAEAARHAADAGGDEDAVLAAARDAAGQGMQHTAIIEARRGRSAKLGARSIGHIDPGAASAFVMLRAMAAALADQ